MIKAFFREFREFALKGNVLDLAVGVIIGAAFGKIVASMTNDIILPPIGLVLGKVDFKALFVALDGKVYASLAEAQAVKAPTLNYGMFINNVIDFTILALVIFLIVKLANRLKRPAPAAEVATKDCPFCCSKIAPKARRCPSCTSEQPAAT